MKRAIGLIFIIISCVAGFLSIRGTMPFMPIFGGSMEPTLHSGSLMLIEPIEAKDVKVGDIIVYNVPSMIRDFYNYPPVVAHRVVEVRTHPAQGFRTKGDNTGEDPFTIMPGDLRGTVGNQIPYLGLPLLFFQSTQGMIFVIISLSLLVFFLYGGELSYGGNMLHRGIFAPVIRESYRTNRVLAQKIETTEHKMDSTEQALVKFSAAIELYAQHLSSHTSAIQGLSEASHELKRSAAEQNKVIMHLMENMEQPRPRKEDTISRLAQAMQERGKTLPQAEKPIPKAEQPVPAAVKSQSPPGCAISRKALAKRILEAAGRGDRNL